jgi:MHS family proline/betaine transporter-like MFS transporter
MVIGAGSVGNILEWYDFALYGYFTPILTKLFFPGDDELLGLIATLGIFASGYLMRPVGALLFGHIGDVFGRGRALLISVLLMAVPTFLMGCLPTHGQIGIWAPVLLTVLRLLQGVSVGGEFTGSITYLSEEAPEGHRGLFASFSTFGANVGMLLGAGVGSWLTASLSEPQLMSWGWRIPFWAGVLVASVGILIRSRVPEAAPARSPEREVLHPLREVMSNHLALLLRIVGITWFMAVSFYIPFIFMSTYLTTQTHVPLSISLEITTLAMLTLILLEPLTGHFSDRYGRKPFMLASAIGLLLSAWPVFRVLTDGNPSNDLLAQMLLAALVSLFNGVFPAMMAEMVPLRVRMTLLSLGYGLGMGLFGGTAPLVATLFIQWSGNITAPAWYMMFSAGLGLILLLRTRETRGM